VTNTQTLYTMVHFRLKLALLTTVLSLTEALQHVENSIDGNNAPISGAALEERHSKYGHLHGHDQQNRRMLSSGNADDFFDDDEEISVGSNRKSMITIISDDDVSSSDDKKVMSECRPVTECELCPGGSRSGHSGCERTGKRAKYKCRTQEAVSTTFYTHQSCTRTVLDEEMYMTRFQVYCIIIAFFALRSVKREKNLSASLFERRIIRQEMAPLNGGGNNSSSGNEGSGNDGLSGLGGFSDNASDRV
jgi:hypothetical protein